MKLAWAMRLQRGLAAAKLLYDIWEASDHVFQMVIGW